MEAGASSARADGRKEGRLQRPATALEARGYRLGEIIGTGTFSVVQKAYSNNLKRNVAIKTILKKEVPPKYFETFVRREMEILQGLNHPNVIKFLESIETDKSVHMVMELAENGSLLASLRDHSHFDEEAARRYLGQILDVMEYCYKRGVVHRDIKLENLLLDEGFNIKLTDFGLARAGMFPEDGRPRMSESFCGSYAYAAPEVLTATRHDPYLSDVWSAGVVLYAMVFGRMPFSDRDRRQQDVFC
ncbi:testis-specific serine/threonine-protein kinase 2-like isoform X2 [Bacillus rossius redtenbacheri]|uniref:testis-specific serine/threonine-protein kinase 2-like isoform X2 n=1 Tax=Bacillus rossius redtenbacheri TaxID=93214 RepID=UPI002FDD9779